MDNNTGHSFKHNCFHNSSSTWGNDTILCHERQTRGAVNESSGAGQYSKMWTRQSDGTRLMCGMESTASPSEFGRVKVFSSCGVVGETLSILVSFWFRPSRAHSFPLSRPLFICFRLFGWGLCSLFSPPTNYLASAIRQQTVLPLRRTTTCIISARNRNRPRSVNEQLGVFSQTMYDCKKCNFLLISLCFLRKKSVGLTHLLFTQLWLVVNTQPLNHFNVNKTQSQSSNVSFVFDSGCVNWIILRQRSLSSVYDYVISRMARNEWRDMNRPKSAPDKTSRPIWPWYLLVSSF